MGDRERCCNPFPRSSFIKLYRYNHEFKNTAAKLVREQGYSLSKAAQSLEVDPGSIRRWVRPSPGPTVTRPDASAEDMRRENRQLREENRKLPHGTRNPKKATAFFAKELP